MWMKGNHAFSCKDRGKVNQLLTFGVCGRDISIFLDELFHHPLVDLLYSQH